MSSPPNGFFWNWVKQSIRILHRLWLEVTGFLFLALAVFGLASVLREWPKYQSGEPAWKIVAAGTFTVAMVGFGIYSFLKARRVH